jgi:hypothetical protein
VDWRCHRWLLVVVCNGHDHGGAKGNAVPLFSVFSSIKFAAIATLLVLLFLNSTAGKIAAPFVGGIVGVFGIQAENQLNGPYGGVVSLLVGIIIVLVLAPHIGKLSRRATLARQFAHSSSDSKSCDG